MATSKCWRRDELDEAQDEVGASSRDCIFWSEKHLGEGIQFQFFIYYFSTKIFVYNVIFSIMLT
jgi:hypothetical protein